MNLARVLGDIANVSGIRLGRSRKASEVSINQYRTMSAIYPYGKQSMEMWEIGGLPHYQSMTSQSTLPGYRSFR